MTKRCKQCGDVKQEDQFRPYYNRKSGSYNVCKTCEKINSRRKYLEKQDELSAPEQAELDNILRLYEKQRSIGLQPPKSRKASALPQVIDAMTEKLEKKAEGIQLEIPDDAPFQLTRWVTEKLTNYTPEDLQETYDKLSKIYREVLGIDPVSNLPIYSKKYEAVLNYIGSRFDDYEDEYYAEED